MKRTLILILLLTFIVNARIIAQSYDIYTQTEKTAEFPGGETALLDYLAKNVSYPRVASEAGINGIVFVTFVVNKDGSTEQWKIERDIGGGCGAEVIRVIKNMPNWNPAQLNSKPVRTLFTLPVSFQSGDDKLSRKERKASRRANRKK